MEEDGFREGSERKKRRVRAEELLERFFSHLVEEREDS